ncbi:PREDICTED: protein ARABIDILLO 2-like [Camelina sativa]|uniref:Protein ARABIDILLO 2-like n=1 Tax=Camelina sativa TaxID=90675 RepID=A0ABM0WNU5_CAMSA|nr:PREDICTED: protein ARABIDILLO 2-like [Camelina sativa]
MSRRVRQRVEEKGKNKLDSPSYRYPVIGNDEDVAPKVQEYADWTSLPYDTVLYLFNRLNYRDRASLASTCRTWRSLGASSCLWNSLDLRAHKFDLSMAPTLATRCAHLQKVRFRGVDSADAIIHLRARNLLEISGDYCRKITDATLSMIAARHDALESLQLGPDFCEKITSDAIRVIAFCCPKLKKLRVSGMRDVSSEAIESLAKHCPQLSDLGFLDCLNINEEALGKVVSVRYLSVAGTSNIKWKVALDNWEKLPKLTCLDVSRTTIDHIAVSRLLKSSQSLKVLCALNFFRWPTGCDGVLERAAGALANLAADDKCSTEVARAGGVHALVMLARNCKYEGAQEQAARALANLAAHGDSNNNNAAVGQEAGALDALLQLTQSLHDGVKQEAAGALWNLSFDDKNRESIAAFGGVEALVALAKSCSNASTGLQERAAGALWGLSVSEANSIAIGRDGGIPPLIALAGSEAEDVHETAAGALWNLAFNPGNALRIVEEGGVKSLVHLCLTSVSKMARFMAALALAYMFDGRMDEYAMIGTSSESASKSVTLNGARMMALKHIGAFIKTFMEHQIFTGGALSFAPSMLAQVAEKARIPEAGHLRCSGSEIGRFVTMLRNHDDTLKACAAFALLQFTIPGGRHAMHHASLMQNAGEARALRSAAAAANVPRGARIFAKIVLRNLEHHQAESSKGKKVSYNRI